MFCGSYCRVLVLCAERNVAEDELAQRERALRGISPSWCTTQPDVDGGEVGVGDGALSVVEAAAAAAVAAVLRGIAGGGERQEGVAMTLLGDYVEVVANAAFGLGDSAFLLACFT